MIKAWIGAAFAALLFVGAAAGESAEPTEAYELLFREGVLDAIDPAATLIYRRETSNTLRPEVAERAAGDVALQLSGGEGAGMAKLELRQGDKSRSLGVFPVSVGNPMIMVFYESIVRDMAATAGGSPFYIRNRVKEALLQPTAVTTGEAMLDGERIEVRTVRMRPFDGDPNADRMLGFGNLEMVVTMSDDVPGWYLNLKAAAGPGETPVYSTDMQFQKLEASE